MSPYRRGAGPAARIIYTFTIYTVDNNPGLGVARSVDRIYIYVYRESRGACELSWLCHLNLIEGTQL